MKLKPLVLAAIKGNPELRARIREKLGVSNPTMTRLLNANSDDLTKAASMEEIRKEYGLDDDEILIADTVSEVKEGQN